MSNEVKLNVSQSRGYENANLELIKIETNEQGQKLVSGRELHEVLEIGTPYHKWMPRMIEYGFKENIDFAVMDKNVPNSNGGKQTQMDHVLTLEMAKHIAMVQRTEIGMKVRNYFIECEKKAQENSVPKTYAQALLEAGRLALEVERQQALIEEKTKTISILTHVNKLYTATEIAKELGFKSAIEFNKKLCEDKIQYKTNGTYILYSEHAGFGYDSIKQNVLDNGRVIYDRKWTQLGREFLIKKYGA